MENPNPKEGVVLKKKDKTKLIVIWAIKFKSVQSDTYKKLTRNRLISENSRFQKMEKPNPKENVVFRKVPYNKGLQ